MPLISQFFYGICSILLSYPSNHAQVNEPLCIFPAFAVSLCAFGGNTRTISPMSTIPDFTESQIWTVKSTLKERFKHGIDEYDARAAHEFQQQEEAGNRWAPAQRI